MFCDRRYEELADAGRAQMRTLDCGNPLPLWVQQPAAELNAG